MTALTEGTPEELEKARLYRFNKWLERCPEQARYHCRHGRYVGADHCFNNTKDFGCKDCKSEKEERKDS